MRKAFAFLFFLSIFISCSKSEGTLTPNIPETPSAVEQGIQSFSITNKEITSKRSTDLAAKEFIPAYVFVSIETSEGSTVLGRQKIDVIEQGGNFVTEEIMLDPGTYKITEFIVVDSDDTVISLVPKANSALSQFSGTSLPYNFTVKEADSNNTPIENIEAAGFSWIEFGYEADDLIFSVAEEFFTLTVDDSESITTKIISLKSLTGSTYQIDWGDGTIEEYVSNQSEVTENQEITHKYEQNGIYGIKIIGAIKVLTNVILKSVSEDDYYTNLVSVDLNNLTMLKEFGAYGGQLSSIDITQNNLLEVIWLGHHKISSIDVTKNTKLKAMHFNDNELTSLDVSQNLELETLFVGNNLLSNLDVTNNTKLNTLIAYGNALTQIDISSNLELEQLGLHLNDLSALDVTNNVKLVYLNMGSNNISEIDFLNNVNLVFLELYDNQISTIDVSNSPELFSLFIKDNLIDEIDLSNNLKLESLSIQNNNLSDLNLSNNTLISLLHIGLNQFTESKLDQIISGVYDNTVINSITGGNIDFQYNPGTELIDQTTVDKVNELRESYGWSVNNNLYP